MGSNFVPGYNPILLAASEAALGTYPTPANVAAMAALYLPTTKADLGPAQAPVVRPAQDRNRGRGMTDLYVPGRYEAVPWNVMTAMRSRADADDPLRELVLWKAAGMKITTNAATSVVISPSEEPVSNGDFVSASLTRILGRAPTSGVSEMEMETLLGCFADTVRVEGGDKEVMLTFSGMGQSKSGLGAGSPNLSVADGSTTSVTVTAAQSYGFAVGYYLWESEIVYVSAVTYGGTSITIARAQLGSSGVAHSSKPMHPYIPTGISVGGTPISEALTTSCTFDGTAFRVLNWSVDIKTGLAALPGETGSALPYQGVKSTRYEVTPTITFVLKGDDVAKFNKARVRTEMAVSLVQGTTAGGILTIAFPQCELIAPKVEDNANDSVNVQAQLRCRDSSAGNDMLSLTVT